MDATELNLVCGRAEESLCASLCELSLKFVKNNHQIMDVQLEDDQFPEDIKPSLNIAADFGAA